jgi:hypothetical protein
MNKTAEKHLLKAEGYLAKGEEFYRKAAAEFIAAKEADHTLSNREIAERFGKHESWARKIVAWGTSSSGTATPWEDNEQVDVRKARMVLRDNPEAVATEIARAMRDPEIARKVVEDEEAHRTTYMATHQAPERVSRPYRDPTFIDLIVKVSNTLMELRSLLAKCEDASGIPPEFSEASMDDIAAKAMHIKEMVKALRSDSNDEWQRIVRELREA